MEKRRRARINQSLNELKRILLEANGPASAARKEVMITVCSKQNPVVFFFIFLNFMLLYCISLFIIYTSIALSSLTLLHPLSQTHITSFILIGLNS